MRHALIVAHPKPESFTLAVAQAYADAARARGHDVQLRDLYRMKFSPCLEADEMPGTEFAPRPDVAAEREVLSRVDAFAFFYPFWLNAPPAMMKGYMERVFGMGFAYGPSKGGNVPLLKGRKMISFTSSGAPTEWVVKTGAWDAARKLFDEHLASMCGFDLLDHVHFGGIVPNIRKDVIARHLAEVRERVTRFF